MQTAAFLFRIAIGCGAIFVLYASTLRSLDDDSRQPAQTLRRADGDDDFDLASRQSFGFFDDIPATHWLKLREIYLSHQNHRDPARPLWFSGHDPQSARDRQWNVGERAWYQNNYEPNFSCQFEKRLGGETANGDGPKWVCDPHRIRRQALERTAIDPNHPGCVVYSIGSNGDFNFELGVEKEVGAGICEFHIFDMGNYAQKMPKGLQRAHYHQWGLKKQGQNGPMSKGPLAGQKYYGLKDTVKMLGHENLEAIDIFKIDCEGCEWTTYQDFVGEGIPRLQQIQVEVHGVPKQPKESVLNFFDTLEAAGFLRFHKEPNIQWNPGCLEYAMVKVDTEFMNGKNYTFNTKQFTMRDGQLESVR